MPGKPAPLPLAMMICDVIIDDRKTGKKSLIGIFNNINVRKVPCIHPKLNVFISLTEGNGEYDGLLKCVYEDEDKTIAQLKGPVKFKDPHQIIEFNFEIVGLKLPNYGKYRFEFYCNEEPVISRKFRLTQIKV